MMSCTPVGGTPSITGGGSSYARTTVLVSADEPAFAGHYPGFPVFPGACVLEYIHRSVLAVGPQFGQPSVELVAVKSVRFLRPVFAGDMLSIEIDLCREGEHWSCVATASTERGRVVQAN